MSELRALTLENFRTVTGLPITRVTRTGDERETMRYEIALDDGKLLRVSDLTLWSPAEFAKESAVKLVRRVNPMAPSKWRTAIEALVIHVVEVLDAPGETFAETVHDWLRAYTSGASDGEKARAEAAPAGRPFIEDGLIHVTASDFALHVRKMRAEQVKLVEVRQALRDIGLQQHTVNYKRNGRVDRWSTVSYYRGDVALVEASGSSER